MNNLRKLPSSVSIYRPVRLLSRHDFNQLRSVRFLYNPKLIEENRQKKLMDKERAQNRAEQKEKRYEERRQELKDTHYFRPLRVPDFMKKLIQSIPNTALMMGLHCQTTIPGKPLLSNIRVLSKSGKFSKKACKCLETFT